MPIKFGQVRCDLVTGSLQSSSFSILFMFSNLYQDDPVYTMNLADLRLEGSKAYNKKDYSTAVKLYSVVCCMMHSFIAIRSFLKLWGIAM